MGLAGDSGKTRELKTLIARVAPSNAAVLVSGPTGSGKDRIVQAAGRMQNLIEGLLSFSRMGREGLNVERVDLDAMLREVVVGLHVMMAGITVETEGLAITNSLDGHPIFAWSTWLVQVMPLFFVMGGFSSLLAWRRQRDRGTRATREIGAPQRHLLHQQFLELHPPPGGMFTARERMGVGIGRRMVQRAQGFGEAGQAQAIVTASGQHLPTRIDSICVHGDGPDAVASAQQIRLALEKAGFQLAPLTALV